MSAIRGELNGFANAYVMSQGGSGKLSRSVDATQHALAVNMVKVATQNMSSQFDNYSWLFSDIA